MLVLTRIVVISVLVADLVLVVGLVVLKAVHRARVTRYNIRRDRYVALLSRHLAFDHAVDPIPKEAAEDDAFLDAVIDLRNTVTGSQIDKLAFFANRFGLVDRQASRLRKSILLTRRLRAAVSLAELGDKSAAPVLSEHLEDREDEIRIQAARGLARIGHTPAIDHIVARLDRENPWVRARFGDSLASFGIAASQPLMAFVRVNQVDGDPASVVQAITTLGVIGDHGVGPQLADVLKITSDPEIKIAAITALGSVGGSFAQNALVDELHSADWRIRAKTATAIGEIGDEHVVEDLGAALQDRAWWVRRNAAAALAGRSDGLPVLYRSLSSPDPFARDAAAEALADVGELSRAVNCHAEGRADRDQLRLLRHVSPLVGATL